MSKTKEIKSQEVLSNYSGSEKTYELVAGQISERYGKKEVKNYDPYKNCLSFKQWISNGYKVKKGEKSLKSITVIEETDEKGKVTKRHTRTINLFYYLQVEKI